MVFPFQLERLVSGEIRRLDQDAKIQKALVQAFCYILGIAAVEVEMDGRERCLDIPDHSGDLFHHPGLSAADVDIAADGITQGDKFGLGLVHHGDDLLCTFSQQHALRRKSHPVTLADQERLPQLFFQIFELAGEGGLGEMQIVCGGSDATFSCYGKKVAKYADFHSVPPSGRM